MNIDWSKCPEATHFDPVDQNFLREIGESLLLFNTMRGWTVPIYTQYGVTIKDCNRPLIKRPEWTGEGLPPVGTVCEFAGFNPEETLPTDPRVGDQVTVIAHFMSGSFEVAAFTYHAPPEFEYLQVAQGAHGCFRPIRTPEQIAEEARIAELNLMVGAIKDYPGGRHGVDHMTQLKIHEEACINLYDAGWRKQV
jgi:hypothetical protein